MSIAKQPRFLDRTTPPTLFALIVLSSISPLSMNFFLPSLPRMAEDFGTSASILGMSVGIFLATSAVFQILIGPMIDNYGRRPVVLWCLGIFIVATLLVPIAAVNTVSFLILRTFQATSAACIVTSRAIVRDVTDSPEASSARLAYVTMGMAIAPMIGPTLGGYIDGLYGWEANFYFIAGLAFAVLGFCYFDQAETLHKKGKGLLDQIALYPELLRSKRFWAYCVALSFGASSFFIFLGAAPYVGGTLYGLSPQNLGLFIGAPALGYIAGNYLSGRFSVRFGIERMVVVGLLITFSALSVASLGILNGMGSVVLLFGVMSVSGIGNGITMPSATAGMMSVRPHLAGTASGLGGSIMIAVGGGLSVFASLIMEDQTTEAPMALVMWISSGIGLLCGFYVIYVQRKNRM
ncbi:MAG: multidrug effflux MFS transporter [Paracoccaceae bacterium]|jgi:DHA1 family bicyclomycin/chloramphenicol resistance-like MFS transporter